MQDSSTNPYIPQETQQARAATQALSSPLKRVAKLLMIITLVLSILIGAGLLFIAPRTSAEDAQARVELANALHPTAQLSKLIPVKSTLGFSLKYDNLLFTSYAETTPPVDKATGKVGASAYYENDDLRTVRDYNYVRITPVESTDSDRSAVADPPQLVVTTPVTLDELKKSADKPDYKELSQLGLFVQVSTDKRLAAKAADDGTTVSIDATKPSARTINDVKYQFVRYTTKNENYRIVNEKYDDCYYTIQNDVPVAACITNVRPNSRDDAALGEQALQTLTFHKPVTPVTEEPATAAADTKADDASKESVSDEPEQLPLETPKPEYNTNFTSLNVIAKVQPSVVRIGTLYCADLNLKVASGDVATTLTDACVGSLSSGTFVTQDGLIATTGHAIRYAPKAAISGYINFAENQRELLERLDRVLDYLLTARIILESDAEYLRNGAQIGDQEALAKIENIGSLIPDNYVTPTNDNYSYAVQPTNKPLVIDTSTAARPTFAYSDAVIKGTFVAADYDVKKTSQDKFDSATPPKDVGLLKVEGTFQNVPVGSGTDVKSNNILNIVGFPSYSDRSLVIGKHQNAPIVTNAKVNQTYDQDGQQLIQTGAPVVPGTDGGGTFDQNGKLIGFGVYGLSYCPDRQCFATGTIRSASELHKLMDDKNLALGSLSEASTTWSAGVDEYFKGNYAAASSNFAKAGTMYGFNVFASPLQKLAESKKGSASDTSMMNQLMSVLIAVLIVMVVLTILSMILFLVQKKRLDAMYVGHYGADVPAFTPPVMTQPQQVMTQPQPTYPQPQQYPGQVTPQPGYDQQQYPQAQPVQQYPQQGMAPQQPPYQQPITPPVQSAPAIDPASPQQPPAQPQNVTEDPFYRQ